MIVILSLLSALAPTSHARAEEPVKILTSIKPLALIIEEAFGEIVSVDYLLPPQASPHHYSLKPSDLRKLNQAELFVWVGPGLENFVSGILKNRPSESTLSLLEAMELSSPNLLIHLDESERHSHGHQEVSVHSESAHAEDNNSEHAIDPHLWLSRSIAVAAAQAVGSYLTEHGNDSEAVLGAIGTFAENLTAATQDSGKVDDLHLITYHNAFAYLAVDLKLIITDVVTPQTDVNPGARHIVQLSEKTHSQQTCVIVEPQFNSGLVDKIFRQKGAHIIEVDPMAGEHSSYTEFFNTLLKQLIACRSQIS